MFTPVCAPLFEFLDVAGCNQLDSRPALCRSHRSEWRPSRTLCFGPDQNSQGARSASTCLAHYANRQLLAVIRQLCGGGCVATKQGELQATRCSLFGVNHRAGGTDEAGTRYEGRIFLMTEPGAVADDAGAVRGTLCAG